VMGTIEYSPLKVLKLIGQAELNSSRYSTSYGTKTPQYTLLNTYVSSKILKYFSIDAGLSNILDRNYSMTEGYPEEGRNFFVNLRFFNL
jgi:iron complex outermembrane receptor protein